MNGRHDCPAGITSTIRNAFFPWITSLFLILIFTTPILCHNREDISSDLEKRLKQILDEKTKGFFDEMVLKERYLNFVVQSLNREIKLRKKKGVSIDNTELGLIFGVDEGMIQRYEKELATILHLLDELNTLERRSKSAQNDVSLAKIERLKLRLKSILDVTDVGERDTYSNNLASRLLADYNKEIDQILLIVKELRRLKARNATSPQIQTRIIELEREVSNALSVREEEDPLVSHYAEEMIKVVQVLRQLDELERQVAEDQLDIHQRIRQIKGSIFKVVDPDVLASLGYRQPASGRGKELVNSYFDEWKARQVLWYRAKQKQAELVKIRLVQTGTPAQIRRMFEADVWQAVNEYNQGNFETAGYLFQDILKYYPYPHMDDFRYYLAECYLLEKQYAHAQELYLQIIKNNQEREYVKKAYWRLMLISDTFNRYADFFDYADRCLKLYHSYRDDKFLEKVVFYAGYMAYRIGDYRKSLALLGNLPPKSPYYMPGQFLIAVDYLNFNRREKALPLLTMLSKKSSYSHDDPMAKALRNQALLKIGLIYYQDDDLVNALHTLEKVDAQTPGFDVVLLSKAWTLFRLGDLSQAADVLDLLFWNHLSSNYVYEAMMLSAHCNRLLGNIKSAIRKVRYVENAEKTARIYDQFNVERQKITDLLSQIDKMEEAVVFSEDVYVFQRLNELRHDLEMALEAMTYRGDPGLQLIQEYQEEQQRIEKLIADYQDLNEIADILGRKELKKGIRRIIPRLESELLEIQKFQKVKRVDILSDYPLAQKESNLRFQRQKLQTLRNEAEVEQRKLEFFKEKIAALLEKAEARKNPEVLSQLNYRKLELDELKKKLEVFMVFISESDLKPLDTDFRKWSDFSGFGMSDLDFVRMKTIEKKIQRYNDHIELINAAFRHREKEILRHLALMDEKISNLEQAVARKNIQAVKAERERYFREDFFVNQTSETQIDADQNLKILLEREKFSTEPGKKEKNEQR